jgi:hypothetical protein
MDLMNRSTVFLGLLRKAKADDTLMIRGKVKLNLDLDKISNNMDISM